MRTYKIEWQTEITDSLGDGTKYPVAGYTLLRADSYEEASMVAFEGLCDVDFFCPNDKLSASDGNVVDGEMWVEGLRRGHDLGTVLPDVEVWDFENVDITNVSPA